MQISLGQSRFVLLYKFKLIFSEMPPDTHLSGNYRNKQKRTAVGQDVKHLGPRALWWACKERGCLGSRLRGWEGRRRKLCHGDRAFLSGDGNLWSW